ncbi:PAS domain S-box protein [Chachezhania sediminis]|uniref:PAS domain S-box protein n=1 Tax=Chachezhania sediminis TaxID=2599291 RepID=UPI00131C39B3|nr:PAS domain S-box protein [Chachezhania sediminis]
MNRNNTQPPISPRQGEHAGSGTAADWQGQRTGRARELEWILDVFDDIETFATLRGLQPISSELSALRQRLSPLLRLNLAELQSFGAVPQGCGATDILRNVNNRAAAAKEEFFALFQSGLPNVERLMLEFAPVMVHSFDDRGTLLEVSSYWLDVMGYTRDQVIGTRIQDLFTPESRERALVRQSRLFEDGRVDDIELDVIRADGEVVTVTVSAALRYETASGQPCSIVLTRL